MKLIKMKPPLMQKRNMITLWLHPVVHYRLLVEIARRKALGEKPTASTITNDALLHQLPPLPDENTVLDGYTPRRKSGRPRKQAAQPMPPPQQEAQTQ